MNKVKAIRALREIVEAIIETVREAGPDGAPASSIYMALAEHGCSLSKFEQIMGTLVEVGKLTKRGHLYLIGDGGRP
jgi:hypothetical protein